MELILTLAMKFWQWTILIAVVIIGAIINFTDARKKPKLKFKYNELPSMQALPIPTKVLRFSLFGLIRFIFIIFP